MMKICLTNLTVDTVEVLEVTSNLSQLPDDTGLKMKYPMTDEDASNIEEVTHDSKLEIKYFIDEDEVKY